MNKKNHMINMMITLLLGAAGPSIYAQTVNTWRGDAINADWNESYKWKLSHPPAQGEAAHFREGNSVISINSTVQLDNGMHLYGQELLLKGNGNINLWSVVPHERTVNIPASSTGYANMTLCDNLSLNGRIALAAKGYGTSASKGSITLKDRSTVTGGLSIGNEGTGSGQVYVKDNATFRINSLELETKSELGGMAEIFIMGGTVRIETGQNPFGVFLADPSRKIIIGDTGTLRIESDLPIDQKKEMIKEMITNNRLVAAPGCRLTPPILQDEMVIARAEDAHLHSNTKNQEALLSAIDNISETAPAASTTPSDLGDLVKALKSQDNNIASTSDQNNETIAASKEAKPRVAGYIVFLGTVLLALRRAPNDQNP